MILAWHRAFAAFPDVVVVWITPHPLIPDISLRIADALILAGATVDQAIVVRRAHAGTTAWPIDWPDVDVRQIAALNYDDCGAVMRPVDALVDEIVSAARALAQK